MHFQIVEVCDRKDVHIDWATESIDFIVFERPFVRKAKLFGDATTWDVVDGAPEGDSASNENGKCHFGHELRRSGRDTLALSAFPDPVSNFELRDAPVDVMQAASPHNRAAMREDGEVEGCARFPVFLAQLAMLDGFRKARNRGCPSHARVERVVGFKNGPEDCFCIGRDGLPEAN